MSSTTCTCGTDRTCPVHAGGAPLEERPEWDVIAEADATRRDLEWFTAHPQRLYRVREPVVGEGAAQPGQDGAQVVAVICVETHPGADGQRVRAGVTRWPSKSEASRIAYQLLARSRGAGVSVGGQS